MKQKVKDILLAAIIVAITVGTGMIMLLGIYMQGGMS